MRLWQMALITRPAVDVYGLGIWLPSIFFRKIGEEFSWDTFSLGGKLPGDAQTDILNRQNFVANIEENVKNLNEKLPVNLRYEEAQLSFIIKLIQACTNPNPLMRPTAAQACALLEAFDAETLDFDAAFQLAKEDRPSEEIPEATLEVYRKYNII